MKKLLLTTALIMLAKPAVAKNYVIKEISDPTGDKPYYFQPDHLTIQPGDTVTFVDDQDATHDVMFDVVPKAVKKDIIMGPMQSKKGAEWSYTFDVPGSYHFHCHPHEALGMTGTLVVGQASAPGDTKNVDHDEMEEHMKGGMPMHDMNGMPGMGNMQHMEDTGTMHKMDDMHGDHEHMEMMHDHKSMMDSPTDMQGHMTLKAMEPQYICMVNNAVFDKPQIPVEVNGETYYGCCSMCKTTLEQDASSRQAVDPVSGKTVDKAKAVIGASPDGKVYYFENEENMRKFKG